MNVREMCFYNNSVSEIQTSSSEGVFMHVSQCHWCTGKAYSPSHRFSSPETKLWPSDSESPPTTSPATEAGQEESGEKEKGETEGERDKDSDRKGKIKGKGKRGKIGQGQ